MGEKVLEIKGLSKRYHSRTVVDKLSFDAYAGEIIGFLGPNGAGKTTTIRMITGLIKPDSGSTVICGFDLKSQYEQAMVHVGAIVETPHLYENMTGMDNLKLFAQLHKANKVQLEKVITSSGLSNRLKEKVKGYSLGMKQRLGIAIALIHEPKLLILDEPTNGLDPVGIKSLRDFLHKLAHENNVCVFVSSHMLLEMQQVCDRVAIISSGKLLGTESILDIEARGLDLEGLFIQYTGDNNIIQ